MSLARSGPARSRAPSGAALYLQLARRSFHRASTYRGATVAGVFTNSVFGFLRAYVLLAVFAARDNVGGFDAIDAVTYVFLTQGLMATIWVFGGLDLGDRIRTGDVVADLYRPMDFHGYWAAQEAGRAAFQAIFRGVPPFVVGAVAFSLRLPPDLGAWCAFVMALVLAVGVGFGWRFLVSLTGFWMLDTRGVTQLATVVMGFCSGFIIPLTFFPAGVASVLNLLPFASMVQLPVEVFLGHHRAIGDLIGVLAQQLLWLVLLAAAGRYVAARAFRKVVVQGG